MINNIAVSSTANSIQLIDYVWQFTFQGGSTIAIIVGCSIGVVFLITTSLFYRYYKRKYGEVQRRRQVLGTNTTATFLPRLNVTENNRNDTERPGQLRPDISIHRDRPTAPTYPPQEGTYQFLLSIIYSFYHSSNYNYRHINILVYWLCYLFKLNITLYVHHRLSVSSRDRKRVFIAKHFYR